MGASPGFRYPLERMLRNVLPFSTVAAGLVVVACTSAVTGSGQSSSSSSGGSSDDASSSTSTSSSGSSSGATSLSIDGSSITVDDAELRTETLGLNAYDLVLRFANATYPTGTEIAVHAEWVGIGCKIGNNGLLFRPANDVPYSAAQTSTCGLDIRKIPLTKLGRFEGTFEGTVTSSNDPAKTHSITLSFDIARTE